MRETCARVLAAALMTGAIGFALAMPALVGTSRDAVRSLTAPPSSLQRSVHVVAIAPPRPVRAGRLEGTSPAVRAVPAAAVPAAGRQSNREPRSAPKPAPSPTPQPAPATDTRTLADETPAPSAVQPAAPTQPAAASGTRKGKARGLDKQKAKPSPAEPQPDQPVPAATPQPPDEPTQPEGEKQDHGQRHDKGKGGNAKGGEG